jgi:hypothetical protein
MKFFTHAGHELPFYVQKSGKTTTTWDFPGKSVQKLKRFMLSFLFFIAFVPWALAADPVTGRVTDDKGNPIPGVTVQVKGKEGCNYGQ